ncbi:DUF84 family protein [Bacillus massiliglaciei]|uniref:DUF84 family protein n=1 Tax=Bacillus massiliglaciei TaxID=1816693 RepID=UPI000DA5FB23|nr:DUF84 family protein [Bacillus massiliglaciei]
MKVAVGSFNPAKVQAVQQAFEPYNAEIIKLNVPSGVSDQPFSDDETIEGALNRARQCLLESDCEFGVGLEGGVAEGKQGLFICNWGALAARGGGSFIAGGARILLPPEIADRLRAGGELGPIMDQYTQKAGIRKKEGAIGVFTNEKMTRSDMFLQITKMLLGQFEYKQKIQS